MSPPREVYAFNSTIVNLLKAVKERVFYVKVNGEFTSPPKPGSRPAFAMSRLMAKKAGSCGICTDDFAFACIGTQLPCGHTYHHDCIVPWVEECRSQDRTPSCPTCRDTRVHEHLSVDDSETIYDRRLGAIQSRILELCPRVSPLEREEFPLQYTGKKRAVYQRAVESLYVRGISRKDGELSNFTKTERTTKQGAVPRNISPRDPRYNVEVGRVIKPAEGILLNGIAKLLGSKTVMKGMNAAQIGEQFHRKWERMGGDGRAVAIGLDASRFDQHVSRQALEWEHKFYTGLLTSPSDRKWLRHLLKWQIHNKAFGRCADGWLRYEIEGTRCSGDMNTGLGNCLIACSLLIAYCTERKVPFELANNGDDCVIICDKRHLTRFSEGLDHWFKEMGFNMVVEEPVYELEKVVFCQSQPVFDGFSWTMVRDPRSCIAKDCVSLKPWNNRKEYEAWIKCVGMSGTSLAGGIPVLDAFYRSFTRAGRDAKPLSLHDPTLHGGLFWQSKGMHRRELSISETARYSFWRAFDITPDEQRCIEDEYNATTPYYQSVRKDWEFLPVHEHLLLS